MDGNRDNRANSVQLGWNQTELGNEKLEIFENEKSISEDDIDSDILNMNMDNSYSSEGDLKLIDEGENPINETSELDLQINQMVEKSDSMWKCKVCGKT